MTGPLDGVRILDLSNILMGPFATQLLGDMGADVIKIEPPGGDALRDANSGRHAGMGNLFLNSNRNKRSLTLNLKHPDGRAALLRLIARSDVLVTNVRPRAMARLGLAYADVAALNSRMIYVSCTGFGQNGPYADRPAYDDLIQAMTGVPDLIARAYGGGPRYMPSNFCDRVTGLNVVNAVSAALYYRERSGRGQSIEVPMFETMVQFLMSDHLGGHTFEPPTGPTGYARIVNDFRRPYKTSDGQIGVIVYNDKQWAQFFALIGQPEHAGQGIFADISARGRNIAEVYRFVEAKIREHSTREWLAMLATSDIPHTAAIEFESLFDDAHLRAVEFFPELDHPSEGRVRTTAVPSRWSESQPDIRTLAPRLGEHGRELLAECGYTDVEIDALARSGATTIPAAE